MTEQERLEASDGERPDVFRYSALIRYAKLLRNEKHLLRFYADVHNWKTNRWSEYSTHRICSLVSMSTKTFREARKNLEDLGWIVIHWRGDRTAPTIELKIGRDDPRYEGKEWAGWWLPAGGYNQEFSGNPFDSAPSIGVEKRKSQMEMLRDDYLDEDYDQQFKDWNLKQGMADGEFQTTFPEIEKKLNGRKARKVSFKPVEQEEDNYPPSDDRLGVSDLTEW